MHLFSKQVGQLVTGFFLKRSPYFKEIQMFMEDLESLFAILEENINTSACTRLKLAFLKIPLFLKQSERAENK